MRFYFEVLLALACTVVEVALAVRASVGALGVTRFA